MVDEERPNSPVDNPTKLLVKNIPPEKLEQTRQLVDKEWLKFQKVCPYREL